MNQDFKLKFDRMLDNDPTPKESALNKAESYPDGSNTRNLCFSLLDGRSIFLNYSYLISGELKPEGPEIILEYTTHTVKITGNNLDQLFIELIRHLPKLIVCDEPRYSSLAEADKPSITGIEVLKNN